MEHYEPFNFHSYGHPLGNIGQIGLQKLMVQDLDCNKHSNFRDNLPSLVIGHRGAAGYAPENTIDSLRKAKTLGVRWVEFDVKLSRDNIPILFHDDTLDRTTNGRGNLLDYSISELRQLDAGSWFGQQYANATIPTLQDAVSILTQFSMGANIEIKPSPKCEVITGDIVGKFLRENWPTALPPPLISSFSAETLKAFTKAAPLFTRALLYLDIPRNWRTQLDQLKINTLHCRSQQLRHGRAKEVIDSGYILRCYTVNNKERAKQLLKWGVHGIISDYPDKLGKQL